MTLRFRDMTTAYYAGSFNPFTIGHKSIVDRAIRIFDKIVIGVGFNLNKPESETAACQRASEIAKLFANDTRIKVETYNCLTVQAAKKVGASVLLRGVRNCADFEYEQQIAQVNRRLSGIETLIMFALPEDACVSSSMVRELQEFGQDVSQFLP